jgi:hydrogenase maturation protein HypF
VRAFSAAELATLRTVLAKGLNAPRTSSAGRLFDAVASLTALRQQVRYEGQAAMELEFAADGIESEEAYEIGIQPFHEPHPLTPSGGEGARRVGEGDSAVFTAPMRSSRIVEASPDPEGNSALRTPPSAFVVDWGPTVAAILEDLSRRTAVGVIAAKFHNALTEAIVAVARQVGESRVVLTGGCFQNRRLTERTVRRLREEGFRPYWHQRVPPNDGGIALGQIVAALRRSG